MVGEIPALCAPGDTMGTKGEKTILEGRINTKPPGEGYFRSWNVAWLLGEPYQSPELVIKAESNHFIYKYVKLWLGAGIRAVLCCVQVAGSCHLVPGMLPGHPTPHWASEGSSYLPCSWGCSCFSVLLAVWAAVLLKDSWGPWAWGCGCCRFLAPGAGRSVGQGETGYR